MPVNEGVFDIAMVSELVPSMSRGPKSDPPPTNVNATEVLLKLIPPELFVPTMFTILVAAVLSKIARSPL
jgi:hypothetical protein